MSDLSGTGSADTPAAELRRMQQQRQQRFFIAFAMIEGVVLAATVIVVYVLQLVDPDVGMWLLLAVALLGGAVLSGVLITAPARNQRELDALTRG